MRTRDRVIRTRARSVREDTLVEGTAGEDRGPIRRFHLVIVTDQRCSAEEAAG